MFCRHRCILSVFTTLELIRISDVSRYLWQSLSALALLENQPSKYQLYNSV